MSAPPLTAHQARRVLLLLSFTRWFPVGLVIGVTTLLPLERGMTLTQIGIILSMQGFVVLALELPTGGFADALGRRPLLVASTVVALGSALLYVFAQTFAAFCVALLLQGVFRALDSGPLESWYVDTAQADDPDVEVEQGLSRAGTVLGLAIASGAVLSGGVIAWHPDRLHRSPRELEDFIDLMERTGCTVVTVTAGEYDLATPEGRLTARIVGSVARKESEDKSRRIRRKHLELAEAGRHVGGRAFGYEPGGVDVRPSEGALVVDTSDLTIDEVVEALAAKAGS